MIEKEVKVFYGTRVIEAILISKGCVLESDEVQENIIYRDSSGSTNKLRKTVYMDGDMLIETKYEHITKSTCSGDMYITGDITFKIREENTVTLDESSYNNMALVLGKVCTVVLHGVKRRRKYILNGFIYDIDEWEHSIFPIPYLEIECIDPLSNLDDGIKQIFLTKGAISKIVLSSLGITELHKLYIGMRDPSLICLLELIRKGS